MNYLKMGNNTLEKENEDLKRKLNNMQTELKIQGNNISNLSNSLSQYKNFYENQMENLRISHENEISQYINLINHSDNEKKYFMDLLETQQKLLLKGENIDSQAAQSQNEINMKMQELLTNMEKKQRELNQEQEKREMQREQNYKQMIENQNKIQKNYFERMGKKRQNEELLRQQEMEKLEKLEKERKQRDEEFKKDMINKINELNDYQNKITQIKKEAEEAERESQERHRIQIEKMNQREIELKQMIEDEKDRAKKEALEKERKQFEERKKKEQEVENDFNIHYDFFIKKEIKSFIFDFNNLENDFCQQEFSKYNLKKNIVNLIKKLNETENLDSRVLNMIQIIALIFSQNNHNDEINHLNIILVGPTGVGKSTLINSILKLPKNLEAKTQATDPCTMGEPHFYCSEKIPFLRLADSRGIEKGKYRVEQVINSTVNFIKNQLKTNNPDQFIHCIWYCTTDSRFEDIEVETLKNLAALYDNSTLPIIFVYTRAVVPEFYQNMKKKVDNLGLKLEFVDIIAKEMEISSSQNLKPKNLSKLKKISIEKAKNAIKSSCFTALKENIKNYVKQHLENNKEKTNEMLQNKIDNEFKNFQEGTKLDNMICVIQNIILTIIITYLSGPNIEEQQISNEGNEYIKNFLTGFFDISMSFYEKCLDNIIEKKVKECLEKLNTIKLDIFERHKISNPNIKTNEEFEKEIKNLLYKSVKSKAELFCMKNAGKFITKPVKDYFEKFIKNKYIKMIEENKKAQKIFQDEAQKKFNRLSNLINIDESEVSTSINE